MKHRFQIAAWCALGLGAALLAADTSAEAQNRPSSDRPPARQSAPPRSAGSYHPQNAPRAQAPRAQNPPRGGNANRQPDHRPGGNPNPRAYDNRGTSRNDRPQNTYRQQG